MGGRNARGRAPWEMDVAPGRRQYPQELAFSPKSSTTLGGGDPPAPPGSMKAPLPPPDSVCSSPLTHEQTEEGGGCQRGFASRVEGRERGSPVSARRCGSGDFVVA